MTTNPSSETAQVAHLKPSGPGIRAALLRFALLAGLWLVIAGTDPNSWLIGLPTIMLATWLSIRLSQHRPLSPGLRLTALIRFLPYFAVESVRGGIDVAQRVLRRRVKIDPGFQRYRPRIKHPIGRVVFLDIISLLPGTLSADLRDGVIEVHALDASSDLAPGLQRLEHLVGQLFGEALEEARG